MQPSCEAPAFLLGKCVSIGYTRPMNKKDVGLRIRVDRELRDDFVTACQNQDKPAAQILREFMRAYVRQHLPANLTASTHKLEGNR